MTTPPSTVAVQRPLPVVSIAAELGRATIEDIRELLAQYESLIGFAQDLTVLMGLTYDLGTGQFTTNVDWWDSEPDTLERGPKDTDAWKEPQAATLPPEENAVAAQRVTGLRLPNFLAVWRRE